MSYNIVDISWVISQFHTGDTRYCPRRSGDKNMLFTLITSNTSTYLDATHVEIYALIRDVLMLWLNCVKLSDFDDHTDFNF